jgi:hypothetical protein
VWLVHEQVAVAALECGSVPLAAQLIKAVLQRFPEESMRAKRLQVRWGEVAWLRCCRVRVAGASLTAAAVLL